MYLKYMDEHFGFQSLIPLFWEIQRPCYSVTPVYSSTAKWQRKTENMKYAMLHRACPIQRHHHFDCFHGTILCFVFHLWFVFIGYRRVIFYILLYLGLKCLCTSFDSNIVIFKFHDYITMLCIKSTWIKIISSESSVQSIRWALTKNSFY